jgi:hypothetical protein
MAETMLVSALERQKWIDDYLSEYVRESGFLPYMGKGKNRVIMSKHELQSEAGKIINVPFIPRLKGPGVKGSQALDGLEEQMFQHNCQVSIEWRRNAVLVAKSTTYKTEIDLYNAGRDGLKAWSSEQLRDDIIRAMLQATAAGDSSGNTAAIHLVDSTANQRNTYGQNNQDRILYGATKSNYNATFATALQNIDTSADKFTTTIASLAKRMARQADPHIRPMRIEDGREYYIAFHGSRTFRDLKLDSNMVSANRDARARENSGMNSNPIFQDGDLIYDGVIHREVPEIDDVCAATTKTDGTSGGYSLDGVGASTSDVRPVFMCGVQAVAMAWGQEPTPVNETKDYGFRRGVGIEELLGVRKIAYEGRQHGMVTVFCSAAADA